MDAETPDKGRRVCACLVQDWWRGHTFFQQGVRERRALVPYAPCCQQEELRVTSSCRSQEAAEVHSQLP